MLATMIGFGRTPAQGAATRARGSVVIMPRRGIVVLDSDVRKQLRLLEVRGGVAPYVVGRTAARPVVHLSP